MNIAEILQMYLGALNVEKIYLGENIIFENPPIVK